MIVTNRSPAEIKKAQRRAAGVKIVGPSIVVTGEHLKMTTSQTDALTMALLELAMTMDDDGQEGTFDRTPLRPILDQLKEIRRQRR